MKDLIARYVYDVTRRLPENTRAEVAKELNANIADMLPKNPTEEDIVDVLQKLGEPRELAAGYRTTQRCLISPKWMDEYLMVLKIVLIVFGAVTLVFGLIENIASFEETTSLGIVLEVFGQTFADVIGGLFQAFTMVTLVFAAIDYYGAKVKKEPWSPKCLPELPKQNVKKISRAESIAGIIFGIIFGSLFIYFLQQNQLYIGWIEGGVWSGIEIPLFNDAVVQTFIPFFIASVVIGVFNELVKLAVGHWNIATATSHTVERLFSISLLIAFTNAANLLNPAFLTQAATYFDSSVDVISEGIVSGTTGFTALLAILVAIDLISTWIRVIKTSSRTAE